LVGVAVHGTGVSVEVAVGGTEVLAEPITITSSGVSTGVLVGGTAILAAGGRRGVLVWCLARGRVGCGVDVAVGRAARVHVEGTSDATVARPAGVERGRAVAVIVG
jgi:hypothetical protein